MLINTSLLLESFIKGNEPEISFDTENGPQGKKG